MREAREVAHKQSAFARWGRGVSDQPWPWAIGAVVVLLVLTIPLFSIRLGQLDAGTDPTSDSSRKAYDLVAQGFGPGANGPLTVVVDLPSADQSSNQTLLTNLQTTLTKTPVAAVATPSVNKQGTTAIMNVIPTTSPQALTALDGHVRTRSSEPRPQLIWRPAIRT